MDIEMSASTKCQLKVTILTFQSKFAQKRYFWSKIEEASINIEFWKFKLATDAKNYN